MAIWSILLQFRTFYGHLGIFCPFWYIVPKKSGNPGSKTSAQKDVFTTEILTSQLYPSDAVAQILRDPPFHRVVGQNANFY
jgi:hypothetical protein